MNALNLYDREISKIFLIDDNPSVREGYEGAIEDLGVATEEIVSVGDLRDLYSKVGTGDGFICDFHLNSAKYSPVNGDVIVSGLYERKVPAVLCSKDANTAHSVRRFRHSIPRIITARDFSPDSVVEAFTVCIKEFSGEYSLDRRPWNTLIRLEELISDAGEVARVLITVPGWDTKSSLEIEISRQDIYFYDQIISSLAQGEMYRCKAKVNLDARSADDLYVKEWVEI